MMKTNIIFLFFLLAAALPAQEPVPHTSGKGVAPLNPQSEIRNPKSTRAVVVGISDYQSPQIPGLQYADEDARAFAGWLGSRAGGSLPADNIQLLLNAEATLARLTGAFTWLMEESKPGDQGIIYFSGHGDVEVKTAFQLGFLLPWDAPPQNYMAGAYPLFYLQAVISTLSTNNVRMLVVTDACHAGKLAGSDIGGAAITGQNLVKQFSNEIKILSCQPSEYSMEGEQWGGGRGAFSFHLVNGLCGLADRAPRDGTVNLLEIGRYLQDQVGPEVAPHSQTPMTVGPLTEKIAFVDDSTYASVSASNAGRNLDFKMTANRGLEDEVLARADPAARVVWQAFKRSLAEKRFFDATDSCANALYARLGGEKSLEALYNTARRDFAFLLQEEPQQALNALIDNDPYEANNWSFNPGKYAEYPHYLQRSLELLGEGHFAYNGLLAKKWYFEGVNLYKNVGDTESQPALRDSFRLLAKAKYLESIRLQPGAAYPYQAIGHLYFRNEPYQPDSVVLWCSRATGLAPTWLAPYLEIAYTYGGDMADFENAETWLLKALDLNPESYLALERLSWLKQWQGEPDESLAISRRMIAMKPDIFNAYSTAAVTLCQMKGEYLESEQYCLKSLELEPNQQWWAGTTLYLNWIKTRRAELVVRDIKPQLDTAQHLSNEDKGNLLNSLVMALAQLNRFREAEHYFRLSDSLKLGTPPIRAATKMEEGRMYVRQGRWAEAEKTLREALRVDPTDNYSWRLSWALLGEIHARRGEFRIADSLFHKVVTFGDGLFRSFYRDESFFRYGKYLLAQKRYAEAEAQFREIGNILPGSYYHGYGMALLAARRDQPAEALDWLERALDNFWPDAEAVRTEPLFKKIRKTKRFKAMMAKHFPTE